MKDDTSVYPSSDPIEGRFWLLIILLLALFLRLFVPLSASFPLNDGGLFYQMILDLESNRYLIPATTAYNQSSLPFAYPPLGFYLGAFFHAGLGLDLFSVLRIIPPIIACLCLIPAWKIISHLCESSPARLLSFAAYALSYRSYEWLIMGGGITRAPGMLFALMSIWLYLKYAADSSRIHLISASVFAGLTLLSHPHCAVFLLISIAVLWIMREARPRFLSMGLMALAALIIISPWVLALVSHGNHLAFLQAMQTSRFEASSLFRPLLIFLDSPLEPTLLAAGVVAGVIAAVMQRRFLYVVWFCALFFIPRLSQFYTMLPASLLFGLGLSTLLIHSPGTCQAAFQLRGPIGRALMVLVIGTLCAASWLKTSYLWKAVFTPEEVIALQTLSQTTPPNSRFLILTSPDQPHHFVHEWFPALSQRHSLLTAEGKEWSDAAEFKEILQKRNAVFQFVSSTFRDSPASVDDLVTKATRIFAERDLAEGVTLLGWDETSTIGQFAILEKH